VLCEVKTVHISAAEVARRQSGGVGTTLAHVTPEFLGKLRLTIEAARGQMVAYDAAARHIAYVVVNFDDLLHEYVADYRADIEAGLAASPPAAVKVVLDIKPPFHAVTRAG
jgi:hypothetical protein